MILLTFNHKSIHICKVLTLMIKVKTIKNLSGKKILWLKVV